MVITLDDTVLRTTTFHVLHITRTTGISSRNRQESSLSLSRTRTTLYPRRCPCQAIFPSSYPSISVFRSRFSLFFFPSSFLPSSFPFFPTFFHSRYSSKRAKHSNRYHGRSSWNERLWKARHRTEEIASARFLSVLLSARRCTLPGGKTPTRSRAHPSSTLARLYTQGVHTTTVIPGTPYGAFPLLQSHPPASFAPSPESASTPSIQSLHLFYPVTPGTPPPLPYRRNSCARSPNRLEPTIVRSRDRFYSPTIERPPPWRLPPPLNRVYRVYGRAHNLLATSYSWLPRHAAPWLLFRQSIPRFPTESPDLTSHPTRTSLFLLPSSLFPPRATFNPPTILFDVSNATSQWRDIRLFHKVVKCTARLRLACQEGEEQRTMQREQQRKRKDRQQWLRYRLSATINRHRRCLSPRCRFPAAHSRRKIILLLSLSILFSLSFFTSVHAILNSSRLHSRKICVHCSRLGAIFTTGSIGSPSFSVISRGNYTENEGIPSVEES